MAFEISPVRVQVQIFPFEGGTYVFSSDGSNGIQGVLACNVKKNIHSDDPGTFEIILAPGGPNGTSAFPSWTRVLTNLSLVLIGFQRANLDNIVMVGVIRSITEDQDWEDGTGSVQRVIRISGEDFQYFFNSYNFYTMTFLASPALFSMLGLPLGSDSESWLSAISNTLLGGTPEQVGLAFYGNVMLPSLFGLSFNMLSNPNPSNQRSNIFFSKIVEPVLEPYDADVYVPLAVNWLSSEGNWITKFRQIFPWPFYEFFIVTAPSEGLGNPGQTNPDPSSFPDFYDLSFGSGVLTGENLPNYSNQQRFFKNNSSYQELFLNAGTVTFDQIGDVTFPPVKIWMIGRVNPFPLAFPSGSASYSAGATPEKTASLNLSNSKWENLSIFEPIAPLTGTSFKRSSATFSEHEVRNFYMINPQAFQLMFSSAFTNQVSSVLAWPFSVDTSSIVKFGYRPEILESQWIYWGDQNVMPKSSTPGNMYNLGSQMVARMTSYYEPVSMMAYDIMTGPLRPDIIPGSRYRYNPFRDSVYGDWEFYIEGIEHDYVFGRPAFTTLTMTRGLPVSIYGNEYELYNILIGNAYQKNGIYEIGLSKSGIPYEVNPVQQLSLVSQAVDFMAQINAIYTVPQGQRGISN